MSAITQEMASSLSLSLSLVPASSAPLQSPISRDGDCPRRRRKQNRNRRLRNSKAQLLRLNAIYDDDKEDKENDNRGCGSTPRSHGWSCSTASSSFVTHCDNIDVVDADDMDSDIESSDSTSCASPSFLAQARASLRDLDEWLQMASSEESSRSGRDASRNSSQHAKRGTHEAVGGSKTNGDSSRSGSVSRRHSESALSWLQEIKDDDLEQRRRIAEAIATSSLKETSVRSSASSKKSRLGASLKQRSMRLFQHNSSSNNNNSSNSNHNHSKEKPEDNSLGISASIDKQGRKGVSAFLFRGRRGHPSSPCPSQRKERMCTTFEEQRFDDEHDIRTVNTTRSSKNGENPLGIGSNTMSIINENHSRTEDRQPASPLNNNHINTNNTTTDKDKDLQLKRAMLGSARVLTMDGLVESFESPNPAASKAFEARGTEPARAADMETQVVATKIHTTQCRGPSDYSDSDSDSTASGGALAWV